MDGWYKEYMEMQGQKLVGLALGAGQQDSEDEADGEVEAEGEVGLSLPRGDDGVAMKEA